MNSAGFTFGIYPLGVAGTPTGLAVGPQDDYEKMYYRLQELRGDAPKFLARNYVVYTGPDSEAQWLSVLGSYSQLGLIGDLGIGCYQASDLPLDNFLDFVRKVVRQFGPQIDFLQITNEPNLAFMDGSKPYVLPALIRGVLAASEEVEAANLGLKVGFGSVPDGPSALPYFWGNLAEQGGPAFINSVDYVAHNFYVDVFEPPLDLKEIPAAVERILRQLREVNLKKAGIPFSTPIHIGENGWPTGFNAKLKVDRPYDQQAQVIEAVIRTVYRLRQELNITYYAHFGLRDADSSKPDLFHQFGIVRDEYTPKPAFQVYQRLIQEFSSGLLT